MIDTSFYNYALFGNPIKNSLSPLVHNFFKNETGILHNYKSILTPLDSFKKEVDLFFLNHGVGANVTSPFKKNAYLYANKLTKKAIISKSVNTLFKKNDVIIGDNTDGIGLLYDLIRLKYINKKNNILILGSGGAAKGIIPALIDFDCNIFIYNRTVLHAINLINQFNSIGKIKLLNMCYEKDIFFNLVINTCPYSYSKKLNCIPEKFFSNRSFFYDICYLYNKDTIFIDWCKKKGAKYISNGLGMLVSQAAYSFFLWHKIFPNIDRTIEKLLNNIQTK
ncbi:shikimate dehydrogenase [Buchnera aphidicola (Kurisakia onigurumii)]|uniref:shikimate dehydrogenase n=1 Tax=Buchnera aphidicola TaxID=9 RepID=UPI0031B692D6